MTYTIESARGIFPGTQVADAVPATTAMFDQLNIDDKLAFLWYAYTEMGVSITAAAPGVASMALVEGVLVLLVVVELEDPAEVDRLVHRAHDV